MAYSDNSKFKNHGNMIYELRLEGVKGMTDRLAEADLVHYYNLVFLANRYDHQNESRLLGQNNTRGTKGNFK